MRVPMLAAALTFAFGGAALADARVLTVDDGPAVTGSVAGQEVMPAETPAAAAPAAQAASAPAPAKAVPVLPPSRFRFERANDGFLRFDNENGQIAFCAPHASTWACEVVPEDRAALEKEIARQQDLIGRQQDQITRQQDQIGRLQDEIATLKREVAALREPPPPPRPPADLTPAPKEGTKESQKPGDKSNDVVIKLPTQEDIDRATAALQRAWDRVVDMIDHFTKDLSRKAQPDRTTL